MNTSTEYVVELVMPQIQGHNQKLVKGQLLYVVLFQSLKQAIVSKDLPHLWPLPGTRSLAEALGISRSTVIRAYEMLELEQFITVTAGSGYRVSGIDKPQGHKNPDIDMSSPKGHLISRRGVQYLNSYRFVQQGTDSGLAFRPGLPPVDIFPIGRWKNLLNNYWRYVKSSTLNYTHPSGDQLLKEKIRDFLRVSRGISCTTEQIIIVSGSVQSIYLLANTFLDPGDRVLLENPTFPNVIGIFQGSGARVEGIDCDEDGIITQLLPVKSTDTIPKLVHVTPGCQYPLGMPLSLDRRKELIQWVHENDSLIIENDYEHEIPDRSKLLPPIFTLDPNARTIYLGTFNRLLYPSIRLGFMVCPVELAHAVAALQAHAHRFVSPYLQEVMRQFIDKNFLYFHLRNLSAEAPERERLFRKLFPFSSETGYFGSPEPARSLHLTFHLRGTDGGLAAESDLFRKLAKVGISAHPLSRCYLPDTKPRGGLILGYSAVPPVLIREKLKMLQML